MLRDLFSRMGAFWRASGGSGASSRLKWWICFSGALHLVLIVTLLAVPTTRARREPSVPVYTVDLVEGSAPAPGTAARKPAPQQKKPVQLEPPPAAKAPPPPPPPPKQERVEKPPEPEVKEVPPPEKPKKKVVEPKKKVKPKKKVVKPKKTVKPKKKVVKPKKKTVKPKKKVVKPKKTVKPKKKVAKPKKAVKPKKTAAKPKKAVKPRKKVAKPKKTVKPKKNVAKSKGDAKKTAAVVERLRQRRIDDVVAQARERARSNQAPVGKGKGKGNGVGPVASGPGRTGGVVRGMAFVRYYNHMLDRIKGNWNWFDKRRVLEVTVGFGVAADGEIFGLRLLKPSGDKSYDESVVRAVQGANPLPPPPRSHARDFAQVELTFRPGDRDG